MSRSLDLLVTDVATHLMAATAATSTRVSQEVLPDLVAYFDVDVSFLRHNDHNIHATKLIAEWPLRAEVPDPDPLGVIYFADADPIFATAEHAKEPVIVRPERDADYQPRNFTVGGVGLRRLRAGRFDRDSGVVGSWRRRVSCGDAGFHGPGGGCSFLGLSGREAGGQGMARTRLKASANCCAQGQVSGIRRISMREWLTRRAAVCSSR